MSFEAESNSELTMIIPAYQLHFRCKTKYTNKNFVGHPDRHTWQYCWSLWFSTRSAWLSDEFQKVCYSSVYYWWTSWFYIQRQQLITVSYSIKWSVLVSHFNCMEKSLKICKEHFKIEIGLYCSIISLLLMIK